MSRRQQQAQLPQPLGKRGLESAVGPQRLHALAEAGAAQPHQEGTTGAAPLRCDPLAELRLLRARARDSAGSRTAEPFVVAWSCWLQPCGRTRLVSIESRRGYQYPALHTLRVRQSARDDFASTVDAMSVIKAADVHRSTAAAASLTLPLVTRQSVAEDNKITTGISTYPVRDRGAAAPAQLRRARHPARGSAEVEIAGEVTPLRALRHHLRRRRESSTRSATRGTPP